MIFPDNIKLVKDFFIQDYIRLCSVTTLWDIKVTLLSFTFLSDSIMPVTAVLNEIWRKGPLYDLTTLCSSGSLTHFCKIDDRDGALLFDMITYLSLLILFPNLSPTRQSDIRFSK